MVQKNPSTKAPNQSPPSTIRENSCRFVVSATGINPSNNTHMKITLNGKEKEIQENSNIPHLLNTLELTGKPVVIEHNKTAIFPRDYPRITLKENDQIEIINIAAGG